MSHDTCNDYCLSYGCQRQPDCKEKIERIERVAKVAKRKTVRQHASRAAKTFFRRVAFGFLSLVAVLGMCAAVVMIFNGVK